MRSRAIKCCAKSLAQTPPSEDLVAVKGLATFESSQKSISCTIKGVTMDKCIDHPKRKSVAFVMTDWGIIPVCRKCFNEHRSMYNKIRNI